MWETSWYDNKPPMHILPLGDIRPHIESPNCPCNPRIEEDGRLIVHNAYDGRDRQERFDEEFGVKE